MEKAFIYGESMPALMLIVLEKPLSFLVHRSESALRCATHSRHSIHGVILEPEVQTRIFRVVKKKLAQW